MNLQRYQKIRAAVLNEAKSVEDKKRLSYTSGDANVLRNFVSDAEFVGTNQLQNCLTHFMKQVRGISSYVQHPDVVPSETLLSRAADIVNYVVLMVANAEDSGRETGLEKTFNTTITLFEELGQVSEESWKKLLSGGGGGRYTPIHKDEIPLATNDGSSTFSSIHKAACNAHDYNFGKDDV